MSATHFLCVTLPKVATEMALRARLQSDTRAEHRRDETAAGGGEGVIRALARAVAVHGARERAATWRQGDFWSRGRKLCPNRSDGGSLSSTAPVRVMQTAFLHDQDPKPKWRIDRYPNRGGSRHQIEWDDVSRKSSHSNFDRCLLGNRFPDVALGGANVPVAQVRGFLGCLGVLIFERREAVFGKGGHLAVVSRP